MRVNDTVILNTIGDASVNDIMGSMLRELDNNNQTSIALYNHFGFSDKYTGIAKIPFSSKRKLSEVTFDDLGTFAMGAPEFVLKPYPAKVERIVKQYAQMGLRVIVLAHSPAAIVGEKLPSVMKPVAIISIADNVREDAVETIKWFKENDVAVKVISGDNPVTVAEVARRAGIKNAEKFISLEGLNDKEVESVANKYTVFGRVSPEQKAVLVRSIKSEGNTVAMTGDGKRYTRFKGSRLRNIRRFGQRGGKKRFTPRIDGQQLRFDAESSCRGQKSYKQYPKLFLALFNENAVYGNSGDHLHMYVPPLSLPPRKHDAFGNGDNRRTFVLPVFTTEQRQSTGQIYCPRYERCDIGRDTYDSMRNVDVPDKRNSARNFRRELQSNVYDSAHLLGLRNGFQSLSAVQRLPRDFMRGDIHHLRTGAIFNHP